MKKSILSLIAGAVVALASCSQSDDMPGQPQEGVQTATFTIQTPAATRGAVTGLSRYIVEAYEGSTATGTPAARVEAATGTLTLGLKKNTEYTFLFWADKGRAKTESAASSGYWNTDDLKAVTITSGKESIGGQAAYCLAQTFNSANFEANKAVTLKNATAQVCFVETKGLSAAKNELQVTYSAGGTLNVGTGSVTDMVGAITHTFTITGQVSANATFAIDYILAPKGEDRVLNLMTIQLNTEDPKPITNVPFRQCFSTHIKGEYSSLGQFTFTITADDGWDGTKEVKETAKVGDYYYKDGTWSTENKATNANPIIGVIFKVNADGTGKVVSPTEPTNLTWGPTNVQTQATSSTSGKENTDKVFALIANQSYTLSDYPIFNACKELRTSTGNDGWCVPVMEEYAALFKVASTIDDKMTAISGTTLFIPSDYSDGYWTSTESGTGSGTIAAYLMVSGSGSTAINKANGHRVRFILDF